MHQNEHLWSKGLDFYLNQEIKRLSLKKHFKAAVKKNGCQNLKVCRLANNLVGLLKTDKSPIYNYGLRDREMEEIR